MNIKKIIKNPYVVAFLFGIAALHIVREVALARRTIPEPLVIVDDWELIDQNGQRFSKKDLKGRIVVADFFFTSCPTICPTLTNAMKEVYKRFQNDTERVHFISISVDPETDTPDVLKEFMKNHDVNRPNWHALTGTKEEIYRVVSEKMRVHVGEKEKIDGASDRYDIPHLAQLALFDQDGNLRGLFKTENTELAALVRAGNFLLEK